MEKKKREMFRVNFDIPKSMHEELRRLMLAAGVVTQKEMFENALTLLRWMMRKKQAGAKVGSHDELTGNFIEFEMPVLDFASRSLVKV